MAGTITERKTDNRLVNDRFNGLRARIDGEVHTDLVRLIMYSTDASDYKEKPLAVVYPRHENDIR